MTYSLTIFNNVYDNKTHRVMSFDGWSGFEKLLYGLSKQPGYKPKKGEKIKGSPLISPALYTPHSTRSNGNVMYWGGWVAMDIDEYSGSFDDAASVFSPYSHICYNSASSTVEKTKFRVILPLTQTVPAEKIRHLWYACNKKFNELGDQQTKDLSRMYYVPAVYPGSNNFIYSGSSKEILDPYALMSETPYVEPSNVQCFSDGLPESLREKLLTYKKEGMRTCENWQTYHDCPYVNKKMIAQYRSLSGGGWYRQMYKIMCSIAGNAFSHGYNISPQQILELCRQIDADTGGWYKQRRMDIECARAVECMSKKI